MKNIFYSFLMIMVFWGGYSCTDNSFLNETVTTDLDSMKVFTDSANIQGFLFQIYRETGFDVKGNRFSKDNKNYGGIQTACDEAQYRRIPAITTDVQFVTGSVNPIVISDDAWKIPFQNIRRVNVFFRGIKDAPIRESLKNRYRAEARFLRAWYYSIMLKHYGGIPIIGDTVYNDGDKMDLIRQSYDSCVNYIVKECERAIEEGPLPARYTGSNYGRVSAGACRGLISRVRLYAASELFNGSAEMAAGTNCPAELLGYPEYDKNRWQLALDAARPLAEYYLQGQPSTFVLYEQHQNTCSDDPDIKDEPGYGFFNVLCPSASNLGGLDRGVYQEIIFDCRSLGERDKEVWFQPPSRSGTEKSGYPYQELVDAFPMSDGSKFDWNNLTHAKDPFANRDPRLVNTILYDGVGLAESNNRPERKPVEIAIRANGTSGEDAVYVGTPTGYYINKGVNRYMAGFTMGGYAQQLQLIRLAEILLNYAEAYNELKLADNNNGPILNDEWQTYGVLKRLRKRGGINKGEGNLATDMFGLKPNMTRMEMRQAIRDERRIELAFEGHRFWDVRRWKIAEQTETQQMHGMEVRLKDDGTKEYTVFTVGAAHVFRKAMYYWPIPYQEITRSPSLIQNPHYNL